MSTGNPLKFIGQKFKHRRSGHIYVISDAAADSKQSGSWLHKTSVIYHRLGEPGKRYSDWLDSFLSRMEPLDGQA